MADVLRVCALYPDLMNIYADRGNLQLLRRRCEWRGLGFELSGVGRGVQGLALDRGQVLGAQHLVTILAAPDVEEVVGVRVERVAEAGARELEADAAPFAALAQQ